MTTLRDITDSYTTLRNKFTNKVKISMSEIASIKEQIVKFKEKQTKDINACVTICNTVMKNMSQTISNAFPDDPMLSIYSDVMLNIINTKPNEPISLFILHVYKNDEYRKNIMAKNDNFFITNEYKNIVGNDTKDMESMFIFKKCWGSLGEDMKELIRNFMITLVSTSKKYVEAKASMLDVNDINGKLADITNLI